ncbi:HlyD family type I secretion periplasmic adaptor subunit [Photobacterium angustum]|uniref:HlyD family type I secretion periplasmic adaptor subunit n=1 Tax=Photobacterium angustum TaxID=661 RepID=UPI0005DF7D33|nr:HlyD family type I secretion periplasmic adaptor subunit [Photobacterium angustum]KJG18754.1 hemolysin D [Photobacterium angustum]KJG25687.1 hemolysin D [Photobacterium angustum]KJG33871.1 hemolysin D [Photobacterium angustum]PSW95004.1 HlyD family type I secretion periplasmic adaptor subunit [Photobacterium angustum]PSX04280.1 HlyD family type I secretion periplasmic adaptor subunit [Photobacterium angustum]
MSSNLKWANQKHAYRSRKIVWLCSLLVISIITWAAYSKLEEVVVGDGKVVPTLAIQKIQSLEGGIIEQVLVKAGEQVKKGQPLIILDDTRFRTAFQESDEHYRTLQAQIKRLKAELDTVKVNTKEKDWKKQITISHQDIAFDDLSKRAQLNAKANYNERIGQIESQLEEAQLTIEQQTEALRDAKSNTSTLYSSLRLVNKEAKMLEGAVKRGAVAEVELIQTRRDQVKLRGEIASSKVAQQKASAALREAIVMRRNLALEFRTSVQAQLNEVTNQFAQLEDSQEGLADQLKRTEITAPMDGTIKDILVRSLGGVVKPGEPIMELVPNDSKLIVEARISPQDIAFVSKGLEATIKFTAYDFVVYGGRKGTVTYVSADALQTEDGTAYYRAHIQLHDDPDTRLQVIPGMQAMVDILTGEKTVLSYWLKPLLRARASALREP